MWLQTTLLFSGPCIHRRFLGSLRRGRSRQGPRPLPLLTVAAPLSWCLGRRHKLQRPPPLLLLSRDGRERRPFRRPPAAPVASERVLGKSPDGVPPLCGWGLPVRALEALASYWSRVLGAVCPEGRMPHPLQGLSSSLHSHPDIVSNMSGRISSVTGLAPGGREDVVQGCLGNRP